MKVLVTGATGFIGYYVIHKLLSHNVEVIASATSLQKAVKKDWFKKVSFVPHIIGEENHENLYSKFFCPDRMIHLAWYGLPNYKQLFHFEQVLPNQYFFLKKLVKEGLKDLTVTGTCLEYGMQQGALSELLTPKPENPYAIAKNSLRSFLEEYKKFETFHFKWVRLFYMYGEGQSASSILPQLELAVASGNDIFNMSKGDQLRDYLPVEKVAENIVNISLQNNVLGIINCSSGSPISIECLVKNYLKEKNANIKLNFGYYPYPDYEPKNFWGDNTKLKSIKDV